MSILKYRTALGRALMGISTLALFSLLSLLSAGCNQDGVGIFYSISQEEKQITSKISEVSVYQVVEANSNTMYALGGLTVWEQTGSNWNSLGGGFAYNIVEDTDTLYAYFNNDDENLAEGRIESYNGTTWTLEDNFSDDGKLMDIGNDTFALKLSGGTLHINSDLAVISGTSVGTVSIVGGTNLVNASITHYLISDSTVYSWDGTALDGSTFIDPPEKTGVFAAITNDGENLYLVTTSGQVFSSPDGGAWNHIITVDGSVEAEYGAASVVDISGTDRLMIGTDDGYYLMELDGTLIASPDDYAASYPELAEALVHQVYQTTGGDIYLATQNGLWKRTGPLAFERQ